MNDIQKFLEHTAYNMRKWSIIATSEAGSGHATTCLSAADIMATLFFYAMHYNPRNYNDPNNDRFILSKGHASPILYAAWKEVGVLTDEDMLTYRRFDSVLEGHPTLRFAYAEAATGALGIGLSIGVGEALSAKLDKRDYYTYVLLGDSEMSEGAIWEAVQLADHYKLNNLIGIIDVNRLGQSTPTMYAHDTQRYSDILTAFGWHTLIIDGHNIEALMHAFDQARANKNKPTMIIAKTFKGYGVEKAQDKEGFHGKAFQRENLPAILKELANRFEQAATKSDYVWRPKLPINTERAVQFIPEKITMPEPNYTLGDSIPTRKAYGQALVKLGDVSQEVVSLDAEVKNSTFAELFEQAHPKRFFQCFIAEQNMVGMGIGFNRRGKIPFISTFGAFFTRAHDQIRMGAIGNASLRMTGSHAGVSIGQDGPSQMALEDIAMMRALPDSVVLYPSDAVSTYKLVNEMARYDNGISYLRTTRMATPVIYANDEEFPIGGCKVIKESKHDQVCIVAAGITLFEALKAYDILALLDTPIFVSIIDLYSIKPLDVETLVKLGNASGGKIITVEDHYLQGGIGETVSAALINSGITVKQLAVTMLPRSGKPEELLAYEAIDAQAIINEVQALL